MINILFGIIIIIGVLVVGSLIMNLLFSVIGWLIIGLVAGLLANLWLKGRGSDLVGNLVLGLCGSLLSGFTLNLLGMGRLDNNFLGGLIFSTLGAALLIGLGRLFTSGKPLYPR